MFTRLFLFLMHSACPCSCLSCFNSVKVFNDVSYLLLNVDFYVSFIAWAERKGYKTAKAARNDVYRAANSLLRLAVDGRLCLCLRPSGYSCLRGKRASNLPRRCSRRCVFKNGSGGWNPSALLCGLQNTGKVTRTCRRSGIFKDGGRRTRGRGTGTTRSQRTRMKTMKSRALAVPKKKRKQRSKPTLLSTCITPCGKASVSESGGRSRRAVGVAQPRPSCWLTLMNFSFLLNLHSLCSSSSLRLCWVDALWLLPTV